MGGRGRWGGRGRGGVRGGRGRGGVRGGRGRGGVRGGRGRGDGKGGRGREGGRGGRGRGGGVGGRRNTHYTNYMAPVNDQLPTVNSVYISLLSLPYTSTHKVTTHLPSDVALAEVLM